jgi:glutathione S-transferase
MAKAKKAKPRAKPKARKRKKLVASARIKAAAVKSARKAAKGAPIRKVLAGKPAAAKRRAAKKSAGLVLYGVHRSIPSCKVGLMLSMLGAKFDYKHVELAAGAHKTPEFQAKNRFMQVPVLQDGDLFICQSNVILGYLAEKFGKFGGRTPAEKLRVAEWLAWDLDRLSSGLGLTRAFTQFLKQDPVVVTFTRGRGEQALDVLDRHLGTAKFLAGPAPTIADIAVFAWVATAEEGGFDIARWPNVQAWALRMLAQPGAAHPYAIMPRQDRPAG